MQNAAMVIAHSLGKSPLSSRGGERARVRGEIMAREMTLIPGPSPYK